MLCRLFRRTFPSITQSKHSSQRVPTGNANVCTVQHFDCDQPKTKTAARPLVVSAPRRRTVDVVTRPAGSHLAVRIPRRKTPNFLGAQLALTVNLTRGEVVDLYARVYTCLHTYIHTYTRVHDKRSGRIFSVLSSSSSCPPVALLSPVAVTSGKTFYLRSFVLPPPPDGVARV